MINVRDWGGLGLTLKCTHQSNLLDLDWSLTIEFFIAISEKYACLNVTDSLQAKLSRSDRIFGNILISKAEGGEN